MKKIMLVEDTPHLSEEIADVLRLEGYSVTAAYDAFKALQLLPETNPDLIITDLLMPKMDGFELIQHIRASPSFASVPIIILSAKSAPEDRQHGKEVGANAFILKPCKAHELVATIRSLLEATSK